MRRTGKIIFITVMLFPALSAVFGNGLAENFYLQDTIGKKYAPEKDCYDNFFENTEKIRKPSAILLTMETAKTISLKKFLNDSDLGMESSAGLKDLDNDNIKELIVYNYTGGAHCCDQYYIFKNTTPDKYKYAGKLFAGDVCITIRNEFIYNFYQLFGYFFTCFACSINMENNNIVEPVQAIMLKYKQGKLTIVPGDENLRKIINQNLAFLGKKPYQPLKDENDQDDGLRKEIAFNLAVFYFSFGRRMDETKKLFDHYYKFPDSKKVWKEFSANIEFVRIQNSF